MKGYTVSHEEYLVYVFLLVQPQRNIAEKIDIVQAEIRIHEINSLFAFFEHLEKDRDFPVLLKKKFLSVFIH
jgi:hypothetical protein